MSGLDFLRPLRWTLIIDAAVVRCHYLFGLQVLELPVQHDDLVVVFLRRLLGLLLRVTSTLFSLPCQKQAWRDYYPEGKFRVGLRQQSKKLGG